MSWGPQGAACVHVQKKRLNKDWQSYEHYEVHCNKIQQTKLAMLPTKPRKNADKCQFLFLWQRKKQECNYNNGKSGKALCMNILEKKIVNVLLMPKGRITITMRNII